MYTSRQQKRTDKSGRVWDVVFILLLAVFTLAVFPKALLLKESFFYFDISWQYYPLRLFFSEQLSTGRLGQWCPHVLCGFPLFAQSQGGPLYPLYLLFYPFMATWKAYNLSTILHLFLAALFMYMYLMLFVPERAAGKDRLGPFVGALSFAFGGFFIQHLIHLNVIATTCWLPLLFYLIERGFREGKTIFFALISAIMGIQALAGHPQFLIFTIAAATAYFIYLAILHGSILPAKLAIMFIAICILGCGLLIGAVQILPCSQLVGFSTRFVESGYSYLTQASYPPCLIATLAAPEIFGNRATDTEWLDPYIPYQETPTYCGIVALIFAAIAVLRLKNSRATFFLGLLSIAFVLMLGKYTLLYRALQYVPIFSHFRNPIRFNLIVMFSICFLASQGITYVISTARPGRKEKTQLLVLAGIMAAIVGAILLRSYGGFLPVSKSLQSATLGRVVLGDLIKRGIILCTAAMLIAFSDKLRTAHLATLIAGLVMVDLYSFAYSKNPTIDPSYFTDAPEHIQFLQQQDGVFRIYSEITEDRWKNPGWRYDMRQYDNALGNLEGYTAIVYGLDVVSGMDALRIAAQKEFVARLTPAKINFLNARYILTMRDLSRQGVEEVFSDTYGNRIFLNQNSLPRAFLVHRVEVEPDRKKMLSRLDDATFPFHAIALVEKNPSIEALSVLPSTPVISRDDVRIESYKPGRYVISASSPLPSLVVLSETFYPGWQAVIDGENKEILRTNYTFLGVELPEGRHTVIFSFSSPPIWAGMVVSCAGVILLFLVIILFGKRRLFVFSEIEPNRNILRSLNMAIIAGLLLLLVVSAVVERSNWEDAFPTVGKIGLYNTMVQPKSFSVKEKSRSQRTWLSCLCETE